MQLILDISPDSNVQNSIECTFSIVFKGSKDLIFFSDYDINFTDNQTIVLSYECNDTDNDLQVLIACNKAVFSKDNVQDLGGYLSNLIKANLNF